jgi:hypothetical protein
MIHLKDASHAYLLAMYCKKTIVMKHGLHVTWTYLLNTKETQMDEKSKNPVLLVMWILIML